MLREAAVSDSITAVPTTSEGVIHSPMLIRGMADPVAPILLGEQLVQPCPSDRDIRPTVHLISCSQEELSGGSH